MCAIVDANVANEVFGPNPTLAGERFFSWINKGSNRLVVGGKLLKELEAGSPCFRDWARQVTLSGRMKILDESEAQARTDQIEQQGLHTSDDPHILAVAQLSGARLLYSNDGELQQDFRDRKLIDPPGSIYSTRKNKKFTSAHKRLLGRRNLCRT